MGYNAIELSEANDGQGDSARVGGGKINANFEELFSRCFKLGDTLVKRFVYDSENLEFDAYKADDKIEGFVDDAKDRFVEGIAKVDAISWPDDVDDTAKFLIVSDSDNKVDVVKLSSTVDKKDKWVIGQDPNISNNDWFMGLSTVADPTTTADFSKLLI